MDAPHPKILIIRLSSIGDIVLTTPIIRALKQQLPNSQIHYLTKETNYILINNNPYVDKLFCYTNSLSETITELRKENYDYVIDLHKQIRSALICCLLHKRHYTYPTLRFRKWLLVNFKINTLPKQHIVDRYFRAVKKLGVSNDGKGLDYFLNEEDFISPDALPLSFADGYVAIALGSKHTTKQMSEDMLVQICQGIPSSIILLGDKNDRQKAIKIENRVGARVFNACGAYNLNQTASLIKNSNGIITPDTSLMHIAAALDKNIISVWGNTVPEFGMTPYRAKDSKAQTYIFETKDLKCRPCSHLGYSTCPKKHFKCMKNINVEKIIAIASSWHQIEDS